VHTTRLAQQLSPIVVVALLAGCGGSAAPRSGSASSSPAATPSPIADTTRARSSAAHRLGAHAQLIAFARSVNLRAQDVPGFTVAPAEAKHRTHNKAFEDTAAYRRCWQGAEQVKPLLELSSRKFKTGSALRSKQLSSTVAVAPSLATARRELRAGKSAIESPNARRCLARVFDALGRQAQAVRVRQARLRITVGKLRFVPIPVSEAARGSDGGFGFSMMLDVSYVVTLRGRTVAYPTSLQLDVLGFVVGRATVGLSSFGLGTAAPPALEANAFSALVSRARSAARAYPAVTR